MPSPFPGMDPYLEDPDVWSDFHTTFITTFRRQLHAVLPPQYVARVDRHVWVQEPDDERLLLGRPDVYAATPAEAEGGAATATIADPFTVELAVQPSEGSRYLRIVDAKSRRVVTVVELLSPSNKTSGPDRTAYLTKRNDYLARRLNLVEIDLLRAGQRMPMGAPPPAQYYVLVARAARMPHAGLWAVSLREPLPPIPVPLDPSVPEVTVDLQRCLSDSYDEGRFAQDIDYVEPPVPVLHEPDATWARELLAARTGMGS